MTASARPRTAEPPDLADRVTTDVPATDISASTAPWWRQVAPEVVVLAVLAAVTRLAGLSHPRSVVFDEVYFQQFALHYLDGRFFFDIHPPLGKLLLAGWGALFGVPASLGAGPEAAAALRVLPALAGVLLVLVMYRFVLELGGGRAVATFAAALVVLDGALTVESRLILTDSMLLLFGLGSLTCYLVARRREGRGHWLWLTAAALLAGAAVSVKWTGLAAVGVLGVLWLVETVRGRHGWRPAVARFAVVTLVPAVLYATTFAVHVALLFRSGPGDDFMSARFQSTLVGGETYDPSVSMSFLERFVELNQAIRAADVGLSTSTHPYSSDWWTWPMMPRGVYYWTGAGEAGTAAHIYLLGNPVIWWGLLLGAAVVALGWLRRPDLFVPHLGAFGVLALAWAANVLPFATIERPMFLYHYLFGLLFAIAAVSLGLGILAGWVRADGGWRFPGRWSVGLYAGLLGAVALGFLWFLPIVYGLPLDAGGLDARMWLGSWR